MKKNRLVILKNLTQYLLLILLIFNVQFAFGQKKLVNKKVNVRSSRADVFKIEKTKIEKNFKKNKVEKIENKEKFVEKSSISVKAASWNYTTNTGNIGTTYSWIDCSGGTLLTLGDDAEDSFNWPFSFSFYDNSYTPSNSLSVCSNGFIRLDGTAATSFSSANGYTLSSTSTELGQIIALGTQDCKVGDGGGWVRYLLTGSSPNRVLTVEYNNIEIDYDDAKYADLQVSFYETSNIIVLKFGADNVTRTLADIGIHSGTDGYYNDWQDVDNGTDNTWIEYTPNAPACTTPTNQATALNLTPDYTTIDGTFTAATCSPDGYLVVRSTNSTLSSNPVDGTTYSVGNALGGGTVVQSGAGTSFTANGLSDGTQYYFFIFSQNFSCTGGPVYLTTSPLTGNSTTLSAYSIPYSHNFDTQDNWDVSGTASIWERGNQTVAPFGYSGQTVYGTVLNADYATDNVDAYLETPFFSMSGGVAPRLSFWMDMVSESNWDGGTVQISLNGGIWTTIDPLDYISNAPNDADVDGLADNENGWSGTVPTGDWVKTEFNIFSLTNTGVAVTNTDAVQFRFWFGSDNSGNAYAGWYIDDFDIYEPNDQTSQVDAPSSGQVSAGDISSLKTTSADAVDVFSFDVTDLASGDALPTQVTTFNIHKNGGTADWTDHIAGAELWNGGTKISNLDVTITDTDITFTKNTGTFDVTDGTSEEITLKIWLNTSNVVDNSDMIFEVLQTGHGFVSLPAGSEFNSDFGVATVSNTQTIRVVASQLMFTGQPVNTATSGVALITQPIVSATDENGSVDEDITSSVTLNNSGGLTMSNNSMNFVAGIADFAGSGFQFSSGGKYVMLSASDGTLNSISPSTEIAVDIVGCTIFEEDFESHSNTTDLPSTGATYTWNFLEITSSVNDWGIGTSGDKALTIYRGTNAFQYRGNNDAEQIAYCTTPIDASSFKNLSIEFNWFSDGDPGNDFGTLVWATGDPNIAANWSLVDPTEYSGQTTFISATKDISVCDGQQFYIGFRWINDGTGANGTSFAVDDISIKGFPKFDYNFSYRQDTYEAITGTVVTLDTQAGANISLPAGFDFSYDGAAVASVRANENGWLEMGTSQTASELATNDLSDMANIPLLAPFWDDLTTDAQTKIIYLVEGTAPARTFTIEWRDALWGTKRENFQVKLYETSYVIEFWYGAMSTNNGGSASIGINNSGSCMNKLISVIPGTIPTVSYSAENNSINSATYLNSGLVYIFNPLQMQPYLSWQEASIVVGQVDFATINTVASQTVSAGAYSSSVSSKGVLASTSGSANRVLIWNDIQTSNGAAADVVLGQSDWTSTTSGVSSTELNNPHNVCFTPDGNKIIVVDASNNRVLIWNTVPIDMSGTPYVADVVIGQTDFTSSFSGSSATKLSYPTGAIVLPDGKLLISDFSNNRVLVYNQVPTTNGVAADYVIGQPNLTTTSAGTTADKLGQPWDCAFSPDGKLLISDDNSHRIMIYNEVPAISGVSADLVIGNTVFGPKVGGSGRDEFDQPSVTVSVEGKVAIADYANSRVMVYERIPKINGTPADYVLGQPNFDSSTEFNDGFGNVGSADAKNMHYPYSICFDLNGRLYVNGTRPDGATGMHRIMVYGETPIETSDLELSIVANETNVCVLSDVEYTVEVTNNGGDPASSVVVNAQLPVDIIASSYDASIGTYNQKSGYWSIPYIAVGETVSLTFKGEVQAGLAGTNVIAYANIIASKQKDNDFSNNGDNQVVAVQTYSAPTSTDIADQYINRNSHTIPAISFTVDDVDSGDLANVTYSNTSSNTTLIPLNYSTNLVYAGTAPNKTLDITPIINEYGYSDMELILTDEHGCHKNYDFVVAVGNIWEGNGSMMTLGQETKWDLQDNWSSRNIPSNSIEAIIPTTPVGGYFPIIDVSGAECLDMIIEPKASVTVNGHNDLTIHGDLTIQSDALGTGSLVDLNNNGDVTVLGDITVERYILNDAWHYVSTPLNGVTNKVLTENVCGANYNGNVLDYNEAYVGADWLAGWEAPWATVHNNDPLLTTNGYAYYSTAGQCSNLIEFKGASVSLNTGNYYYSVTNQDENFKPTGTNPHRGWNLIGNPYPSGLNADDFISANSGVIDGTVYFWDELGSSGFDSEGADYAAYNTSGGGITGSGSGSVIPDQYISCGQAFYVHRTNTDVGGTDVNFTNSMREGENSFFFKKKGKNNPEVPKVKLSVANSQKMYNEIVVMLVDDATDEVNPKYDGYKPEGNPNLSFYSIKDESAFIFQGIKPVLSNELRSVPLGIHAGIAGKYTFSAMLIEYIPDTIGVYLEDKVMNNIIDLRKQSSYSVTINETGRFNDRFVLHFNINHAPYLVSGLPDKSINCEEFTFFSIPLNTFIDSDDDELVYSANLISGAKLPNWLNFNSETYTFSGTPSNNDAGLYPIKITATDYYGATAYDNFNLSVLSALGFNGVEKPKVTVYPNPTNGMLYVASNEQNGFVYQISDVTGKVLIKLKSNSKKQQVDISSFVSGIYFVKIIAGNKTSDFKIFLQK